MADEEIDIEEHDVLDNPVIRSIFPDISVIKKEISQYCEDVPNIKQEPDINTLYKKPPSEQIIVLHPDEHVHDAQRKTTDRLTNIVGSSNLVNTQPLISNKIILGSKPSTIVEEIKDGEKPEAVARIPKVMLQDLGTYIYQNNRYCKDCRTLFPSKSDLNVHLQKVHFIKTRNKELNIKVMLEKTDLEQNTNNRCSDCGFQFSNTANLRRHYKNIHKKKVTIISKYKHIKTVSHNMKNSCIKIKTKNRQGNGNVITLGKVSSDQKRHKCNMCNSYFSSSGNLSRHYKNIHKKKVAFKPRHKQNIKVSSAINPSRVAIVNRTTRSQKNLESQYSAPGADNICFHCKKLFPDHKSLIEHIYEVLESKRKPKTKVNKSPIKKENVATFDWPKEKQRTSFKASNKEPLPSKSLKNKLMFEDQDSDSSESLVTQEGNNSDNVETKVKRNKRDNISTAYKPEKEQNNIANDDQNNMDPCCSKMLTTDYESEKQHFENKIPKYLETKEKNVNKRSIEPKTSKRKRHDNENQYPNPCGQHKNSDSKQKNKKQKLQPYRSKNSKTGVALRTDPVENNNTNEIETTSIATDDKNMKMKLQSPDANAIKMTDKFVFECIYCSYMVPTSRAYYMHILGKHKVEKISQVNKVSFYEQCKYCPSKCTNVTAHNKHLYAYHYNLVYRYLPNEVSEELEHKTIRLKNPAFKMFESFVLESIIYKCNKCDIHFLSSSIAKDHEKHMELLINWKCSICRRIFKKHDKHLHLKQHKFSKALNVCQFNESELSRLLYNCTKCAIHFTEDRYSEHFSKCDEETTDSVYCNKCDILLDKHGHKSHETYHRMGKDTSDFTIIVADIIEVTKSKEIEVDRKRKRLYQQINCLTFCQTCKCFLTDIGLTRKTHIESRCSEIPKFICRLCGLYLTHRALVTHKEHHKKQTDLTLQSFKFFDLKGIQINPPIPEYPRCTNCDVTFVRKNDVIIHFCSEIHFITCSICKVKLSEDAFKLHMNFHNYSIQNTSKDTPQAQVTVESQKLKIEMDRPKNTETCLNAVIEGDKTHNEVDTDKTDGENNSRANCVYSCQSCKIAVDTYDKVIEHSQNHFSPVPRIPATLKICSKCTLKFDSDAYENHQKLHMRDDIITFLSFDPTYLTSDNNVWLKHVFASESTQKESVEESIYQNECRIKMEVVQKGPSYLTLYKCDKCGNFIDPDCIFAHVINACPKNIRKHPCSVCGLPFVSINFRNKHEKIHRRYDSVRIKSYNIVMFNSESHRTINNSIIKAGKQFILYQCRTCDGVVDKQQRKVHQCNFDDIKKCLVCGLLIYKADFERHASKHSDLARYDTANMKVILFGTTDESQQKEKILLSSFRGKIIDYTLYKCAKCEVCVDNEISIAKHACTLDDLKWKCPKCSCFIICELNARKHHIEMHDLDLEFQAENINVIKFDLTKSNKNDLDQTEETNYSYKSELESNEDSILGALNADRIITNPNYEISTGEKSGVQEQESVALYKCVLCGLHYTDKLNAKTHVKCCNPKIKVVRQTCSKCSVVFNPKELFSHLVGHHGEKNKSFKFEIVEISAESEDIL